MEKIHTCTVRTNSTQNSQEASLQHSCSKTTALTPHNSKIQVIRKDIGKKLVCFIQAPVLLHAWKRVKWMNGNSYQYRLVDHKPAIPVLEDHYHAHYRCSPALQHAFKFRRSLLSTRSFKSHLSKHKKNVFSLFHQENFLRFTKNKVKQKKAKGLKPEMFYFIFYFLLWHTWFVWMID